MATIGDIEWRIEQVEGFRVRIRHGRDGSDVRSDRGNLKQYGYKNALMRSKRVKEWRDGRFALTYPGFVVDVLTADGNVAHGRTLLCNVRETYLAKS